MSKDDWSVRSRKKKMPCEICKKRSHSTETCWYQANNDSCERCSKYEKDLKDLVSEKESLERDKIQGKNVSVKLRKTDVNKTRRELIQYVADNEEDCPSKKRKTDEGL